jgi:hypothetical protein
VSARTVWIVEWREAPPYDGYEIDAFGNRAAAERCSMDMHFRGETTRLYKVVLDSPVVTRTKKDGPEAE